MFKGMMLGFGFALVPVAIVASLDDSTRPFWPMILFLAGILVGHGMAVAEPAQMRQAAHVVPAPAAPAPLPAAEPVPAPGNSHSKLIDPPHLGAVIEKMIRAYHKGEPYSRRKMAEQGISQPYWSLANHILLKVGLRDGETGAYRSKGSVSDDMELIRRRVEVTPEGVSIDGRQVDLRAVHFII
jgi:hypothetical protein